MKHLHKNRSLLVITACLIAFAALGLFSGWGEKYAADKEMQALCAKDGGVKIYETMTVPKSQFDKWGMPRGKNWDGSNFPSTLDPEYRYSNSTEFLKRGDVLKGEVQMSRNTQRIRRLSDGKLMAESITYGRSGGDHFIHRILGGHPSGLQCPVLPTDLITRVFIQGK